MPPGKSMIFFYESSHNRIALVVRPGYKDHPRDVIAAGILQHLWKEQFCQVHLTKIVGPHHHLKTIFQPTWLTQGHFALGFYKFSTFLWTKSNTLPTRIRTTIVLINFEKIGPLFTPYYVCCVYYFSPF